MITQDRSWEDFGISVEEDATSAVTQWKTSQRIDLSLSVHCHRSVVESPPSPYQQVFNAIGIRVQVPALHVVIV